MCLFTVHPVRCPKKDILFDDIKIDRKVQIFPRGRQFELAGKSCQALGTHGAPRTS
jgi:hypothetical protein